MYTRNGALKVDNFEKKTDIAELDRGGTEQDWPGKGGKVVCA
jgi:hypothetical protein